MPAQHQYVGTWKQSWDAAGLKSTNKFLPRSCCLLCKLASVPGGHMYALMGSSSFCPDFQTHKSASCTFALFELIYCRYSEIILISPSPLLICLWLLLSLLSPIAALEAPRYKRSLTNQTVNVTESLTMECDVEGRPLPRFFWFKDNQPLHQMSGAWINHSSSYTCL